MTSHSSLYFCDNPLEIQILQSLFISDTILKTLVKLQNTGRAFKKGQVLGIFPSYFHREKKILNVTGQN